MTDTAQTWAGIINGAGQLSEIYSSRGMAEQVLGGRGDRDSCRVVPVKVQVVEPVTVKQYLLPVAKPKRGLFGRKKK